MRSFLVVFVLVFQSLSLYAVEKPKPSSSPQESAAKDDESVFRIDSKLMASLFDNAVIEAQKEASTTPTSALLVPLVSYVTLNRLELSNKYFDVAYDESLSATPMIALSMGTISPLLSFRYFETSAAATVGYAYSEGLYRVNANEGGELKDNISLHWLPASASARFAFLGIAKIVQPAIETGIGGYWFQQSGTLDGIEQGFWLPFYRAGLNVRLLDGDGAARQNAFQGAELGVSREYGLSNTHALDLLIYHAGMNFLM